MGYKILLVDDSVTVQKIITLTFSDEGVDVMTVNSGDEAIHRLQYMRPALVMADVSIPGKNGYDICEYVKNHPDMKDTPVVLLVPAFEPYDEERARRIGADQHLTKPFQSIRTLITTVKTLLEGHPPKFATGSLSLNNNIGQAAQVYAPEPIKAPVVEIRPTQPFPDEPEEEIVPTAEPVIETVSEAPVADIWKSEEAWETDDGADLEDVLIPESEPLELTPEPLLEPFEADSLFVTENQQTAAIVEEAVSEPESIFVQKPEPVIAPVVAPVVAIESAPIIETPPAIVEEVVQPAVHSNFDDLDSVLDLDDVLGWPPAAPVATSQALVPTAPIFIATPVESTLQSMTQSVPQSVIDEIVNRVVAQLTEKLTSQLASQLAPEVAELVKQQIQPASASKAAPNQDADALLDLD